MPIKAAYPVGTLAELEERGWKPEEYASCSKPDKDENIGCFRFKECDLKCKGAGPEFLPYEIIKSETQGGGMRQDVAPCYAFLHVRTQVEAAGGVCRILYGADGEMEKAVTVSERQKVGKIKLREWEAAHPNEKAPDYLVRGATDPNHPDMLVYETAIVERKVGKFPRPGENKAMAKSLLAAKLREQEIEKRKQAAVDKRLNIAPADLEGSGGKPRK